MQKLNFMVSMTDHVSKPAHSMMNKMDSVSNSIQSSFSKIAVGGAGLFAAGYAMNRLIGPARELDQALGEVASLDMDNAAAVLTGLTQKSLEFTTTFGGSAAEFVRSSYDIQSAISGLVGNELGTFTEASAILAKGTKADIGVITNYMGTMFGIFKHEANAMGKEKWVEKMAGQTALAVQMFKTNGQGMSEAFSRLGADAQTRGVAMNEQMAVLGKLQETMSGSEAGTRYVAFLSGIGKAQEALGLQFTDTQGRMLPMVQILEKINGKFGTLDTVAELDILEKAFGTKEALKLITLLGADVDGLSASINALGKQTGMQTAIEMAEKIADPFEIAGAKVAALQITLGKALMPTILGFLDVMGEGATSLLRWSNLFPNLTGWVMIATLGVFGLIAGLSILTMTAGGAGIVMAGLAQVMLGVAFIFSWAGLASLTFYGSLLLLGILVVAAIVYWDEWTGAVRKFSGELLETVKGFDFVQDVIKLWDALPIWWASFSDFLSNIKPFDSLARGVDWLLSKFDFVQDVIKLWDALPMWWSNFTDFLSNLNPFDAIAEGVDWLLSKFGSGEELQFCDQLLESVKGFDFVQDVIKLWDALPTWWSNFAKFLTDLNPFDSVAKGAGWLLGKFGFDAELSSGAQAVAVPSLLRPRAQQRDGGGVIQRFTTANSNTDNRKSFGDIVIQNFGAAMGGESFAEELDFAAG